MTKAAFLGALVAGLLVQACGATSKCGPTSAPVDYVVDGDTLVLADDAGTKLRFLLVDTPETTQGKNDCFGQEAKAFTTSSVAGKTVQLSYDEAVCTDRFGRTLAYVKVDGMDLNAELMKRGMACYSFVNGGADRKEEFATYEAEARTNRTGMWGSCTTIPCSQ